MLRALLGRPWARNTVVAGVALTSFLVAATTDALVRARGVERTVTVGATPVPPPIVPASPRCVGGVEGPAGLAPTADAEHTAYFARMLETAPSPTVRANAATVLAHRTLDVETLGALVAALGDENASVRVSVARALGSLAIPATRDALVVRRSTERDESVQAALDEAISRVAPE